MEKVKLPKRIRERMLTTPGLSDTLHLTQWYLQGISKSGMAVPSVARKLRLYFTTHWKAPTSELPSWLMEELKNKGIKAVSNESGVSLQSLRKYRKSMRIPDVMLKRISLSYGYPAEECSNPDPSESDSESFAIRSRMPAWIRRIKDTAVRNLVEQEYYIDPDLAEKYAEIGTVEGIQAMRRKRWDWGGLYE